MRNNSFSRIPAEMRVRVQTDLKLSVSAHHRDLQVGPGAWSGAWSQIRKLEGWSIKPRGQRGAA